MGGDPVPAPSAGVEVPAEPEERRAVAPAARLRAKGTDRSLPRPAETFPYALPEQLHERPRASYEWDFPTAWLLGTQLITGLRDILLSGLFKIDTRDWMVANTIDLRDRATTDEHGRACCWIDFLADTGDSARLVYQLAYLLQQPELEVRNPLVAPSALAPHGERNTGILPGPLPRGAALIIGGDTAYPIATREQLVQRIRAPFLWARDDLEREELAAKRHGKPVERRAAPVEPPVKLLAIPGNHDYYNNLDGYQRQFRPPPRQLSGPRLDLPGYEREQTASYFAVDLPCDWQLLALDVEKSRLATEASKLDPRQQEYFADQIARRPCQKRIVVTSRPPVVYQEVSEAGVELAEVLRNELQLPAPYLDPEHPPAGTPHVTLRPDEVRLDLSGDVHIYERYWGAAPDTEPSSEAAAPGAGAPSAWARRRAQRPPLTRKRKLPPSETWDGRTMRGNETRRRITPQARTNYAAVVTGLGGAFHHPGQVRLGTITPQCAWPPAEVSARAIGERLLRPRKVFQAGAVGVIGVAVAVLCFWLAWSSRALPGSAGNLLDLPFGLPEFRPEMVKAFAHLAAIAAFIGTIGAMVGALFGCTRAVRWLAQPICDRTPARCWWRWSWLTYAVTHHRAVFWVLRWFGGNRRSSWRFLITAPAWVPLIALEIAAIWALTNCRYFGEAGDDYVALYIVATVILLAMVAVAVFVGGAGRGLARAPLALFGIVIGVLVVWTPYAWMRTVSQCNWTALGAIALFLLYLPFRRLLGSGYLFANTQARRIAAIACFVVLAAYYTMLPWWFAPGPVTHPIVGCALAVFFGAYFSCLWLGWYFFVCLQFNAHGNEAGGAARVVQYAEFLRIKLTDDAAEVFVIAAEGPQATDRKRWEFWKADRADHPIHARLVDHFVVQRNAPPRDTD
jgi:hypothetical protein